METRSHNARSNVAGVLEEYGKERPSTSKTELMVLALSEDEWWIPSSHDQREYELMRDGRTCTSLHKLQGQDTRVGRRRSAVLP
jgi:hypothetical protein